MSVIPFIFVINLKRREDRWKRSEKLLKQSFPSFNITRIYAVDAKVKKIKPERALMLSMIQAFENALKQVKKGSDLKKTWVIVTEDDVIPHKQIQDLWKKVERKLNQFKEPPPFLYLGANEYRLKRIRDWRQKQRKQSDIVFKEPVHKGHVTCGAFAILHNVYHLKHNTLPFYKKQVATNGKLNADGCLNNLSLQLMKTNVPNSSICVPNLLIADVSDSDLRRARNQISFAESRRWDLDRYSVELFNFKKPKAPGKSGNNLPRRKSVEETRRKYYEQRKEKMKNGVKGRR